MGKKASDLGTAQQSYEHHQGSCINSAAFKHTAHILLQINQIDLYRIITFNTMKALPSASQS